MIRTAAVEKLTSKIDEQKAEELSKFLDYLPTINDSLEKIKELKESGALDAIINFSYAIKSLKDALNDDSIQNLGNMLSTFMLLLSTTGEHANDVNQIISQASTINYTITKLKELKESGAFDVLVNFAYALKSLRDALTDDAITNIGTTLSLLLDFLPRAQEFLNYALNPSILKIMKALSSDEATKLLTNPPKVTLGGIVKQMTDDDVQKGIGVLFAIAKIIGKSYSQK
ncbi:DUF1641 domain-containing protein [Acidianus ambivalens]|uniref:DUF1641 domain-containing protein n=1 Tax=Acidianus ambivalens TaxID=2283 RepID=A0A650CY60_ACIAM|nr:DUF1641 domain-containing protein [Acidianus ambivalens]MQL54991.1 DUF1641 domain-containing protein [Acidianus ambivalens]QGR22773.1 DUF1641 domain-containing protein [Acidianus ambivalens]